MATDFDVQFVNREFTNEIYDKRQKDPTTFSSNLTQSNSKLAKSLLFRENTNIITFECKWLKNHGPKIKLLPFAVNISFKTCLISLITVFDAKRQAKQRTNCDRL